ncbi:MAG: nitrate reductase [Gammaproteobacteria bacterium]|jgi:nitrate reductase gamma subunit
MTLLDFARGPGLQWSLTILVLGILWRIAGVLFLPRKRDLSEPRGTGTWRGAIGTIFSRSWPNAAFRSRVLFSTLLSYVFHIGLFVVVFFFVPHILLIKDITGLSWPGLPNSIIYFAGVLTIAAMVVLLVRRWTHPVLRVISNFDDYFSWLVTILPVLTGLMTFSHLALRYETMLALHILSVELLFVWLPFSKLGHSFMVFISRGTEGAAFARKGAQS